MIGYCVLAPISGLDLKIQRQSRYQENDSEGVSLRNGRLFPDTVSCDCAEARGRIALLRCRK